MDPEEIQELHAAIQEYREQLSAVAEVIAEHPGNQEAQQIHAELSDALAAAQAAYDDAACSALAAAGYADTTQQQQQQQQQLQQHAVLYEHGHTPAASPHNGSSPMAPSGQQPAASEVAAAAAASSTRVPAAAALAHPGRSAHRMHPANLYCQHEPDFAALAELHPPLAPHVSLHPVTGRARIDFTSWLATKELTAALLAVDFGVAWSLPEGQLVPPVPNRANYVHWLHDLLQLSAPPGPQVRGLDIGCGANFVYCLLGAALYGWHMTGVDITQVALQGAAAICTLNPQLAALLEVRQSRCSMGLLPLPQQQQQAASSAAAAGGSSNRQQQQQQQQHDEEQPSQQQQLQQQGDLAPSVLGPLLGAVADEQETFAFCMCNPPFFSSIKEANQNPNTACGGTAEEMVVPGGELAFIRAMIADSQVLRGRVHWYSSMCGKKATLKVLRQELHSAGVTALRTTELVQGKTSRWAIAWSFAASPNTATMPLLRRSMLKQQPQAQQRQQKVGGGAPQRQKRAGAGAAGGASKLSFRVTAAAADGRKLLQSLGALLTSVGKAQDVQVDTAGWRVGCILPTGGGDLKPQLPQQQQQQQQQQLVEDQQQGHNGGREREPAAKRSRTASGDAAGGVAGIPDTTAAASSAADGLVQVEVCVFQEQRGTFDVVAAVKGQRQQQQQQQAGGDVLLRVFEAVREDLTLMWQVSPVQ